ncbi:hypothetical protein [Gloeothece verrucosa]|nr:hypothetical protein [Gloeothece verrucosa]
MENKKPEFAYQDISVISVVSELHNYFRDLHSYYQIAKGNLLGRLEAAQEKAENQQLKQELEELNKKIAYFHVLNNSISTVDVVLHTPDMISELATPSKV